MVLCTGLTCNLFLHGFLRLSKMNERCVQEDIEMYSLLDEQVFKYGGTMEWIHFKMREEPVKVDEASGGHHTGGSGDFFRQTLTVCKQQSCRQRKQSIGLQTARTGSNEWSDVEKSVGGLEGEGKAAGVSASFTSVFCLSSVFFLSSFFSDPFFLYLLWWN